MIFQPSGHTWAVMGDRVQDPNGRKGTIGVTKMVSVLWDDSYEYDTAIDKATLVPAQDTVESLREVLNERIRYFKGQRDSIWDACWLLGYDPQDFPSIYDVAKEVMINVRLADDHITELTNRDAALFVAIMANDQPNEALKQAAQAFKKKYRP